MKRPLFLLIKLTVSFGLMYLLYRKMPLSEIEGLMLSIDLRFIAPVFFILLANTFLSAWKWHILLKSDGVEISLATLTASYLIGSFLNMFLPSNIGGDSYRIIDIMRRSKDTMRSATSVFADRLSGFLALVCLSLVSSVFVVLQTGNMLYFVLPCTVFVGLVGLIWGLYNQNVMRKIFRMTGVYRFASLANGMEKVFLSFSSYGASLRVVAKVMAISFSFQFLVIVIVYLLASSLGVSLPFFYFSAFVPLISLMEALPVSIFGVGVRDIGYVFFFGSVGMDDIHTRSLAVLFLMMAIVYSLFGGIVLLIRILFPDSVSGRK